MTVIEKSETEREIRVKLMLGVKLSPRQRAYYLLYMASREKAKEFIKNEK